MRQFDVVANPFPQSRSRQPYLVVLQSDLLTQDLQTVVVAPLEPAASGTFADRLNPEIIVDGLACRLIIQELATVRRSVLGQARASADAERDAIIAALDLLFTGF
jgi:toxin CcdB